MALTAANVVSNNTGSAAEEKTSKQFLILRSDQKPFQCGLCSMSFSTNKELLRHVQTYSCSKPFQCGYCQVSFSVNKQLLLHAKLHKLFILVPQENSPVSVCANISNVSGPSSEANSSSCEVTRDSKERGSGSHSDYLASFDSGTSDRTPGVVDDGRDSTALCNSSLQMTTDDGGKHSGIDESLDDNAKNVKNTREENESGSVMTVAQPSSGCEDRVSCLRSSTQNSGHSTGGQAALNNSTEHTEASLFSNISKHTEASLLSDNIEHAESSQLSNSTEHTEISQLSNSTELTETSQLSNSTEHTETSQLRYRTEHTETSLLSNRRELIETSMLSNRTEHTETFQIHQPGRHTSAQFEKGKRFYNCGECDAVFSASPILVNHWKLNHSVCSVCGLVSSDPQQRVKHGNTHGIYTLPERPLMCGICGHKFAKGNRLHSHIRLIHLVSKQDRKKRRSVSVSSEPGEHLKDRKHPAPVPENEMFKCGTCLAVFSSARFLSNHWKSHHSACPVCGETFSDPREHHTHCLMYHGMHIAPEKPFICTVCDATFWVTKSVREHVRNLHQKPVHNPVLVTEADKLPQTREHTGSKDDIELFKCGECDTFFSLVDKLSCHWSLLHSKCILCSESFSAPQDRYRHVELKHDKGTVVLRPFVCGTCGNKFSAPKYLLLHVKKKHNEEYQQHVLCTQSQESAVFAESQELVVHAHNQQFGACAASPVGPDMVKCGECNEEFKLVSGLLNHWLLQHSACSVCGERFTNPGDRHRHFQTKHEALLGKRFACALCGIKWSLVQHLSNHLRKVHKNIWKQMREMEGVESRWTQSNHQDKDQGSSSTEAYTEGGGEHQVKVEDSDTTGDGSADRNRSPNWPDLGQDCADKHEELGFRCGPCDARFVSADQLCAHWTSQHSACGICRENCPDPYNLQQHMQTSHDLDMAEDKPFICATCGAAFLEASCLSSHVQCSHQQKPNSVITQLDTSGCKTYEYSCQCAECGAYFKSTRSLLHHWQDNHQSCSLCGECFGFPRSLHKHLMSSHSQLRVLATPFVCTVCGLRCKLPMSLATHMLDSHSKRITDITGSSVAIEVKGQKKRVAKKKVWFNICHVCGKRTTRLSVHLLSHSNERPRACTLCTKSYKTQNMLNVHMKTHTKEKPYVCEVCGRSFALLNSLTYHVNTHTNARPYKCKLCGEGFNSHTEVRVHRGVHGGFVREMCRLPCKTCGKLIRRSNHRRHMLTHSSLRPFSCKICSKTFRHKGSLKYHMNHSHKSN